MLIDLLLFPLFALLILATGSGFLFLIRKPVCTEPQSLPLYIHLLAGLFAAGFVSLLVNFFLPVYHPVTYGILLLLLVTGIVQMRFRKLRDLFIPGLIILLFSPLVIFILEGPDAGLYHLPHQLLLRTEKIIIGLVNLHSRFGFSSVLEYINAPFWLPNHDFRLLVYTHLLFYTAFFLYLNSLLFHKDSFMRFISVITLLALLKENSYFYWSYGYTDSASGILFALAFFAGWDLIRNGPDHQKNPVFSFLFLTVFAVFLKLSSAVLVLWMATAGIILLFRYKVSLKHIVIYNLVFLIPVSLWILKNILTTGCLLYPASVTCTALPWSAPSAAENDSLWVTAWARHPGSGLYSLSDWSWFSSYWLPANYKFIKSLAETTGLAAVLAFIIIAWNAWSSRKLLLSSKEYFYNFAALVFLVAAGAFWFLKAPDKRFGGGIFLIMAPVISGFLVSGKVPIMDRIPKAVSALLLLFVVYSLGAGSGRVKGSLQNLSDEEWLYFKVRAAEGRAVPHSVFGFQPQDGDRCHLVKHCYPYDRPRPEIIKGYLYVESKK